MDAPGLRDRHKGAEVTKVHPGRSMFCIDLKSTNALDISRAARHPGGRNQTQFTFHGPLICLLHHRSGRAS
jgi:hypothetical protein